MNDFLKMRIVGLTGMSGSGKTTACRVFEANGFHIINCDYVAREVVKSGGKCFNEMEKAFGNKIVTDGTLDRRKTAALIFGNSQIRTRYNGIIYPYISYLVIREISESLNMNILLDAPTLFESGIDDICSEIVSVVCDENISLERIMNRDGISENEARARLNSQHNRAFYESKSNYCIENNGNIETFKADLESII